MMDRETVRNMQSSIPKNKFEKLVHLVGFIIRRIPMKTRFQQFPTLTISLRRQWRPRQITLWWPASWGQD